MDTKQEEVLQIFRDGGALLSGHFLLRSGLHSAHFFQCAQVCQYMDKVTRMAELLIEDLLDRPTLYLGEVRGRGGGRRNGPQDCRAGAAENRPGRDVFGRARHRRGQAHGDQRLQPRGTRQRPEIHQGQFLQVRDSSP